MSVSGQSHSLWNAQWDFSLWNQSPRSEFYRCGRPKTLLPQCVLGPASAGLFFLKTEADFLEDATVGAAQHLSGPPGRPLSDRRRRRLSSITLAPCRKVTGVPGQRSQAARNVARASS